MTEVDIVNYLLEQSEELKVTYNLYQSLLYALQRDDYKLFNNIINTLEQPYSNGVIERNNNTCKLIKRVAYGYRNFNNFKAKILIITNIFRKPKKSNEF